MIHRHWVPRGFLAFIILGMLSITASPGPGAWTVASAAIEHDTSQASSTLVYLPVIMKSYPLQTAYGVEMSGITNSGGLAEIASIRVTWVRRNGVIWSDVEQTKNSPDWGVLSQLEQELINARQNDLEVILIVRGTPTWARLYANSECGPIAPTEYGSFANFMAQLVERYKDPPYDVKYWEIWNEPDAPVTSELLPFGCWGDPADATYFGGDHYGDMLKVVYPAIKAADPEAQVVVGGLLMDCSPQGGCAYPAMAKFLSGILAAGGGNSFDGISFHAYDSYSGSPGQYSHSGWNSAWNTQGPVLAAKAAFLRSVLSTYGVGGKYLINTETAVICGAASDPPGQGVCGSAEYEQTKADYAAQSYAAAAEGLKANIWYSVFGWRNSGLLNGDLTTRPAYDALAFARQTLPNPVFLGPVTSGDVGGASVLGYKLTQDGQEIWLLWSTAATSQPLTLPWTPTEVRDSQGNLISPWNETLSAAETLYLIR